MLFSTAFAYTQNNDNLQAVPDSPITSSGWLNYFPNDSSFGGFSIMSDTKQYVQETKKKVVDNNTQSSNTIWVTSQEWVPPVTHQEWVPPVTHQEWVSPTYKEELVGWDYYGYVHDLNDSSLDVTFNISEYFQSLYHFYPDRIIWLGENFGRDVGGGLGSRTEVLFEAVANGDVWTITTKYQFPDTHRSFTNEIYTVGRYETVVDVPGHYETVIDQPGYYKTVIDQPGYYKDTSHWETVTINHTTEDTIYEDNSHWIDSNSQIPYYPLVSQ